MAKILVADDNSNVQKTVALALSDLGVDVVSVNNGDAAIKKLSDVSPDLVLADIFMPVRNGYEVCEYVKRNSRFTKVPVVLLVGAFDPLDEREAQRVGADGVLKKPFVPPEPLITMVKTLLDRTLGDRLVAVPSGGPALSAQFKSGATPSTERHPVQETPAEAQNEEARPPLGRITFGEGERPMAFGKFLETPDPTPVPPSTGVIEPVEDDQVLTSSRDAALGDPIFWRSEEPEPETDAEESDEDAQESIGLPLGTWTPGEGSLPNRTENDFSEAGGTFELVRDEPDELSKEAPSVAEPSASIVQDPAAQAPLTVESGTLEDLAANPIEWMATAPPLPVEVPLEPVAEPGESDESGESFAEDIPEVQKVQSGETQAPEAISAATPPTMAPAPLGAVSTPPSPPAPAQPQLKIEPQIQEIPVQEIPDPAKTHPSIKPFTFDIETGGTPQIQVPVPAPPVPVPTGIPVRPQFKAESLISEPAKKSPPAKPIDQRTEDTARSIPKEEWADLAATLEPSKPVTPLIAPVKPPPFAVAGQPPESSVIATPVGPTTPPSSTPDPALVDAIVQRIMDKMRPQVVEIITKEFLRPIVQALVHREIEKR